MYQFKYQADVFEIPGVELPIFICIVPASWLSLDLPTIGGRVNYFSSVEQPTVCGDALFEFCEIGSSDNTLRKFSLDIRCEWDECFEKPIVIHAQNSAQCEVVLLNHILGFVSPSAWVAVDIADLISLLKMSSTYYFKFGVGATPTDIFLDLVEPGTYRNIRCQYWMLFGDNQNMTLEHLHEVMLAMEATAFKHEDGDSLMIACMAGVEQDEMLISTLVGCQ
jgi:hypothetical protein